MLSRFKALCRDMVYTDYSVYYSVSLYYLYSVSFKQKVLEKKLKTYFNWSSGKDSALALYYLLKDKSYSVDSLFTTVNSGLNRVTMHGLRRDLLEEQIKSISIPARYAELPLLPGNLDYEAIMKEHVNWFINQGFSHSAFGDIFLEDLKEYRESQLSPFGIQAVFPLWKKDTKEILHEFIDLGFKAITVCIDANKLDKSFAGRIVDHDFISDLPKDVDICGENGEFHTFCFDGSYFKKILKEYNTNGHKSAFWFCDLVPHN